MVNVLTSLWDVLCVVGCVCIILHYIAFHSLLLYLHSSISSCCFFFFFFLVIHFSSVCLALVSITSILNDKICNVFHLPTRKTYFITFCPESERLFLNNNSNHKMPTKHRASLSLVVNKPKINYIPTMRIVISALGVCFYPGCVFLCKISNSVKS